MSFGQRVLANHQELLPVARRLLGRSTRRCLKTSPSLLKQLPQQHQVPFTFLVCELQTDDVLTCLEGACQCKGGSEYGDQCVDDEDTPWCYVPFKTSCEDGIEECEGGVCQYWSEGACEAGAASTTPAVAATPAVTATPAAPAPPVTSGPCLCTMN